jgi:hypothetical protein
LRVWITLTWPSVDGKSKEYSPLSITMVTHQAVQKGVQVKMPWATTNP